MEPASAACAAGTNAAIDVDSIQLSVDSMASCTGERPAAEPTQVCCALSSAFIGKAIGALSPVVLV